MGAYDVINQAKEKVGSVDLNDGLFFGEVKEHLFYEVVKNLLAGRRSGSAATKTRGMVSGGGAKPYRQKGTGRARAGSSRSPIREGGGTIWGPHPRDYSYSVPKKVRRSAMRSALSLKRQENKLLVVEDLKLETPKTKSFVELAKGLNVTNALIVLPEKNENLELASRNLKKFKVVGMEGLNLFDVLKFDQLVLTKGSLEKIERIYAS